MATSRIKGTNEQISTYGAAGFGRDYTVLDTWETATDLDLVTLTQSEVLECYDDADSFDDQISMGGSITSTSYFRILRPAGTISTGSWQGQDGIAASGGVFFHVTTDNIFVNIGEANSSVQDMKVQMTNPTTNNKITIIADGGGGSVIGMICFDCVNADGSERGIRIEDGGYAVNCIFLRGDNWGFQGNGGNAYFYNCTCVDCVQDGFLYSGGVLIAKNCLATGNDTGAGDDFDPGTYTGSTNNASGDTTAPGTSPRISQTFSFVASASGDYHLDSADTGAKTYGVDLSADAVFPFDDDIDGDLRS